MKNLNNNNDVLIIPLHIILLIIVSVLIVNPRSMFKQHGVQNGPKNL